MKVKYFCTDISVQIFLSCTDVDQQETELQNQTKQEQLLLGCCFILRPLHSVCLSKHVNSVHRISVDQTVPDAAKELEAKAAFLA